MLDPGELEHIRALCEEYDRYADEHRSAAREKIVRKTFEFPPPQPPPAPPPPAAAQPATALSGDLIDEIAYGVALIVDDRVQRELEKVRGEMGKEISRLQGQLDVLLALARPEPKTEGGGGEMLDVTPQIATWRN